MPQSQTIPVDRILAPPVTDRDANANADAFAAPRSLAVHVDAHADAVVVHLTKVLADTYVLAVKTHGAHWNVRGPGFFRLHAVYEEQYAALLLAADEIAERIRALDVDAPASMRRLLEASSIGEPPESHDFELMRALRDDHRQVARTCREATIVAEAAGDQATADILVNRATSHDKTAWMLTAAIGR